MMSVPSALARARIDSSSVATAASTAAISARYAARKDSSSSALQRSSPVAPAASDCRLERHGGQHGRGARARRASERVWESVRGGARCRRASRRARGRRADDVYAVRGGGATRARGRGVRGDVSSIARGRGRGGVVVVVRDGERGERECGAAFAIRRDGRARRCSHRRAGGISETATARRGEASGARVSHGRLWALGEMNHFFDSSVCLPLSFRLDHKSLAIWPCLRGVWPSPLGRPP